MNDSVPTEAPQQAPDLSASSMPTGTVTFLFTDIEGSTRLWEQYPEAMRLALAHHDTLLRDAIEARRGAIFKTIGDAFCAAFSLPDDALQAALAAQRALAAEDWSRFFEASLRVRMALHTGAVEHRDRDYFGRPVNRVARLLSIGHGGQTLLSEITADLIQLQLFPEVTLRDLGSHRLKDLQQPEQVRQLCVLDLSDVFPPLRSLSLLRQHNLPQQVTSFIGRERELARVKSLLSETRLLTVVGPGGAGKSRLTLQAAADLLDQFDDGVWLTELAPLSNPGLVTQELAATLGIKEEPGRDLLQTLTDYLRARSALLVIDNCEHLLAACAHLINTLLRACPRVRILASSREGLSIAGETLYRIPSLGLPALEEIRPDQLLQYEAVHLFIERALAASPHFALTSANAPYVAHVCRRLDGIPMALELAAARVRALPVEQIAGRIDDRFRLLTGGSRTALPRQQTLRALIDWSYDMLDDRERLLLCRLSVFTGGWSLEDAEAICSGDAIEEWEVLDLLTQLVDKSLAVYDEQESGSRYRLLETVRQYAQEKLEAIGERSPLQERHTERYLARAEQLGASLESSADQAEAMQILKTESDNLRAALDWLTRCRDHARLIRMTQALARFFLLNALYQEGDQRLSAAAEAARLSEDRAVLAKLLNQRGRIAWNRSDLILARRLYSESYAISRELGDKARLVPALNNLGNIDWAESDFTAARARYQEALELARETGQPHFEGFCSGNLGLLASDQGDFDAATRYFEASLALHLKQHNEKGYAEALMNFAEVARRQGDYATALDRLKRSRERFLTLSSRHEIALTSVRIAQALIDAGHSEEVEETLAEGMRIAREIDDPWSEAPGLLLQGRLLDRQGQLAAALEQYRRALELAEKRHGGGRQFLAELLHQVGRTLLRHGQSAAAARALLAARREAVALGLHDRHEIETVLQEARASLEVEAFAVLEGEATTFSPLQMLAVLP